MSAETKVLRIMMRYERNWVMNANEASIAHSAHSRRVPRMRRVGVFAVLTNVTNDNQLAMVQKRRLPSALT